jgi:ABC-type transport system involved in multi-copper enzyme maturation permease subunit
MLVPFMFGPTPFRDIFLVAGFELRDMLRSRRAILFAAMYMLVAALGSYIFVNILNSVQFAAQSPASQADAGRNRRPFFFGGPQNRRGPADTGNPAVPTATASTPATSTTPSASAKLDVATPSSATPSASGTSSPSPSLPTQVATPATSTKPNEKWLFERNSPFRNVLRGSVDGESAIDFLSGMPAITLFHMFISLLIMPLVIMLTSSESIAQEIQTRGVRFVGLRTGRIEFVLGKVLGQGATIAGMTLLAAAICIAMAAWKLGDFEFMPTLSALLLFWPRLLAYCVAYLGLAALCSMNSSSTVASRTFSIIGLVFLSITHYYAGIYLFNLPSNTAQAMAWHAIDFLTPASHRLDLWYPEPGHYLGAMASLVFLGALYTAIGLIFYRRRDL